MRGASLILLAVLGSASLIQPMSAQSRGSVSPGPTARISSAAVNEDGGVQIEFKNGQSIRVPLETGQAGREKLQVAFSGRAVGWLDIDAPVGSYSVPTTLTVYTVGRPLRHFGDGLMLLDWDFIDDDKHIQFSSSQVHGPGTDWHTIEVHDLETGRLLERWLERSDTADAEVVLVDVRALVTDSGGVALPDTVVSIGAAPAAEPFALTKSNAAGHFTLKGISPGQHEVRFEHPRFKSRAIQITVSPSGEAIDAGTVALERQPARNE
jgi:hypothetical protein